MFESEGVQDLPLPQDEDSAGIVTTPQQSPSSPKPQQDERTLAYVRQIQSPTAGSRKPITSTEAARPNLPTRTPTQPLLGVQIDKAKLAQAVESNLDPEARSLMEQCDVLLENGKQYSSNIEKMLEKRDLCNQRKREVLNRKWNEHVYDPIRRALLDVSRRRSEEAARQQAAASAEAEEDIWTEVIGRKQQLYGEFIDYSNKKDVAFRETYSPEEYYPYAWQSYEPKLSKLKQRLASMDPLQVHEYNRLQEELLLFKCVTGSAAGYTMADMAQIEPGRAVRPSRGEHLPPALQMTPPTRDTDAYVMDVLRLPKRRAAGPTGGRNLSHMPLPWAEFGETGAPGGRDLEHVLDLEFHTQKKRLFPEVSRRMNRAPLSTAELYAPASAPACGRAFASEPLPDIPHERGFERSGTGAEYLLGPPLPSESALLPVPAAIVSADSN